MVIYQVGSDSTKNCQRSFCSETPTETERLEKAALSLRFSGLVKKPEKMGKTDQSREELDQTKRVRSQTCFGRVKIDSHEEAIIKLFHQESNSVITITVVTNSLT